MPQMCQEHWDRLREKVDSPLMGNVIVIQEQLDRHGPEDGDYCPICKYDDGEEILEKAIEETNKHA